MMRDKVVSPASFLPHSLFAYILALIIGPLRQCHAAGAVASCLATRPDYRRARRPGISAGFGDNLLSDRQLEIERPDGPGA